MPQLETVVLAAGQGTRMKSSLPKVLHPLGGRPLLAHVLECALGLEPRGLHVVYGHGGEAVPAALSGYDVQWVHQAQQLGTGHAVAQAIGAVDPASTVLILYGDVPLMRPETLQGLVSQAEAGALALLTVELPNPSGYGRIVRNGAGCVERIVEEKDADANLRAIREVNTGIMAVGARRLGQWLANLSNENAQREYYLTDVIAMAVADGVRVHAALAPDVDEVAGVNDRIQLAHLERVHQRRQAEALMRQGVSLIDPARFDLRGSVTVGQDVTIEPNVILEGRVVLGDRVRIGANCLLRDVEVADGAVIHPMSILEEAAVGRNCQVGPFARLRPGTRLQEKARIGNFVEVKNSEIGAGSKANHLAYIGDTTMGREVNIGAGTITCNYDGANKHRTEIGDNVFIGSDTQLVAPVKVGTGATIGAGSTITRDAPDGELSLSRSKQITLSGWRRPTKKAK